MADATHPARVRSALFVPANRPERIAKALANGADAVIVDLEDAIAKDDKESARQTLEQALDNTGAALWVRVNAVNTPWFEDDLALCARSPRVAGMMLPKTEDSGQLQRAAQAGKPLCALIETAIGVLNLEAIVAGPGLRRLAFGALDLALDLDLREGGSGAATVLDTLRTQLVLHSRARRLTPPLEAVEPDFRDPEKTARQARRAAEMGFGGMLCIHPAQIEPVHAAFTASPAQLAWARRVLEQAAHAGTTFQLDGQMVDEPVLERARRLLVEAEPGT